MVSLQGTLDQIGLNTYLTGTPRDNIQTEYLSYMNMGKNMHWLAGAENRTDENLRKERIHRRMKPESLVDACASNNLPYVIMQWASQTEKMEEEVNTPVFYMQVYATPLMWAARKGNVGIVRFLLEHGADPSVVAGEDKSTALHWALVGGSPDIVRALLDDERTDPNQRNAHGCDAAGSAIAHGQLLLLWMIAEDEHIEREKCLSENRPMPKRQFHKMDNKMTTVTGHTWLHYAAWRNSLTACQYFVERWNFDVDAVDNVGRTPLIWASREGNTEVVEYLLQVGADPFHKDHDGLTALRYAQTRAHPETALALSKMLGQQSGVGSAMSGRVVPLSSKYRRCRDTRAQGTVSAFLRQPMFRAFTLGGMALFWLSAIALMFLPPALSYLVCGVYLFRNYLWLFYHGIPTHQDGSERPDITGMVGRTLNCALRGTWITRYRNPGNMVFFLCVLFFECYAWTRLGLPPLLWFSSPASGALQDGGVSTRSKVSAADKKPSEFFGGFLLQVFLFKDGETMIIKTLTGLLLICLFLIVWIKLRSTANVIPRAREEHWTRSPMWRMLKAREFTFYHPRTFAVERHFQIPVRAFECTELDVHIDRYDNYAMLIDAPISSSNKVGWVMLLTLLCLHQMLMLVWAVQLLRPAMQCTWEDQQWFRPLDGIRASWSGTTPVRVTTAAPIPFIGDDGENVVVNSVQNYLTSPTVTFVNYVMNFLFHGLPCREHTYLEKVATRSNMFTRALYWYVLPSWTSYYGMWVFQMCLLGAIWSGLLAARQWKSAWYGASTIEMANPVAPREDGKLVSIFVPTDSPRKSIVCHDFDPEEEEYYRMVAPSKARAIPPPDANRCIFANTVNGVANILLFLLGQDGRKWRNAKTISFNNSPVGSSLLSSVALPSWDGLLLGMTSGGSAMDKENAPADEPFEERV